MFKIFDCLILFEVIVGFEGYVKRIYVLVIVLIIFGGCDLFYMLMKSEVWIFGNLSVDCDGDIWNGFGE